MRSSLHFFSVHIEFLSRDKKYIKIVLPVVSDTSEYNDTSENFPHTQEWTVCIID